MSKSLYIVFALLALMWAPLSQAADSATVSGKWHFVFDTEGGDRTFDSLLVQTADKVTGKWDMSETKPGADVAGTFVEKTLTLEFPTESEVGPGTLKLKGDLADDGSLTGNWSFADYTGTFKATRIKDEAPK